LTFDRSGYRIGSSGERNEERIALGVNHLAAVSVEGLPKKLRVRGDEVGISRSCLGQQPG
jgi:hypothetical protein